MGRISHKFQCDCSIFHARGAYWSNLIDVCTQFSHRCVAQTLRLLTVEGELEGVE